MTDDDTVYLSRITNAIRRIVGYLFEASTDEFARNTILQDAVLHQIEIASQASKHLSPSFRRKHQGVSCGKLLELSDEMVTSISNEGMMTDPLMSLADVEREHFKTVLAYVNQNRTKAADILGISRVSLISKIRKYNL